MQDLSDDETNTKMQALTYNPKFCSIRQSRSSKQSLRVLFNETGQYLININILHSMQLQQIQVPLTLFSHCTFVTYVWNSCIKKWKENTLRIYPLQNFVIGWIDFMQFYFCFFSSLVSKITNARTHEEFRKIVKLLFLQKE